jgi:hypothetical protein
MHVVVWDPEGEYWEGGMVEEGRAETLRQRGAVLLPTDPELRNLNAVGGYFRRGYGAGLRLNGSPSARALLVIGVLAGRSPVSWCARVVPASEEEFTPTGSLALMPLAQHGVGAQSYKHEAATGHVTKDVLGGWLVGGRGVLHAGAQGLFGLSLYGAMEGARLAWAAVSATREAT